MRTIPNNPRTPHGGGKQGVYRCNCEFCKKTRNERRKTLKARSKTYLGKKRQEGFRYRKSNIDVIRAKDRERGKKKSVLNKGAPRYWTDQEDLIVFRNDLSLVQMAVLLNRTIGSVRNRRYLLRRNRKEES